MTMELLNNVDHHDLRIVTARGRRTEETVNQVLALPSEFAALQRHFPIVFRKSAEGPLRPAAILGLDRDENLFLSEDGSWDAGIYVPAVLRRGPFAIAEDQAGEPKILVDIDDTRLSRTEGTPIFLPQGGHSPFLDEIAEVLRTIYTGQAMLDRLMAALERLDLLRPVDLHVRVSEDEVYAISQVFVIDGERLATIGGAELETLHRDGLLAPIFFAAASLDNIQRLANRKAQAGGVSAPAGA
ncbi:SapC family protein [Alteriqipengyuania lutimaris]|nr:SapC family protein [Alteriqipengyuania lutimaris]